MKFELTVHTRQAIHDYLKATPKQPGEYLFTGRRGPGMNLTTRQYARLVFSEWIAKASTGCSSAHARCDGPRRP
jgi:hypothetical protein